ncbi:hypothetical protein Mapa_002700 [Marchantia paleacea]|nr:hypothetical protein Mapa_002700 [Marchantia paleacea]
MDGNSKQELLLMGKNRNEGTVLEMGIESELYILMCMHLNLDYELGVYYML